MVTGNEDHDQNVVGHLCMSEPKKKRKATNKKKSKLELSGTTPEGRKICSPNKTPPQFWPGRSPPDG